MLAASRCHEVHRKRRAPDRRRSRSLGRFDRTVTWLGRSRELRWTSSDHQDAAVAGTGDYEEESMRSMKMGMVSVMLASALCAVGCISSSSPAEEIEAADETTDVTEPGDAHEIQGKLSPTKIREV